MESNAACPTEAEIEALVNEALPEERVAALLPHIENCLRCRSQMDVASGTKTINLEILSHAEDPTADEQATRSFIQSLKDISYATEVLPARETTELSASELEFLSPSANSGSLGRLGPFEILGVIGRGGMGLVLKAYDTELEREIAIKVLSPSLSSNQRARERFVRESRAAAAIDHENVLPIHLVDHNGEIPFFTMPLVDGTSLQGLLDSAEGHLPVSQIIKIARMVTHGLVAAHEQGLIHRDLKPGNILLDRSGERAWLADFGLARAMESATITQAGTLIGTPQFMAPEQLDDQEPDEQSDLFSLGVVLYYLATGKPPFAGKTTASTIHKVINVQPLEPGKLNPSLPKWLSKLIGTLLAKNPRHRPRSAVEVANTIEKHAHIEASRRARRVHWMIAAGLGLLVMLTTALLWWPEPEPDRCRLSSNGKTYASLAMAVAEAMDGDTITLIEPVIRLDRVLSLGKKKLTIAGLPEQRRTVLDFTPLAESAEARGQEQPLPAIHFEAELSLENLTLVRDRVLLPAG